MDFYTIKKRVKNGVLEIYPDFKVLRSEDIMVRGKSFYAIWDPDIGMWNTDEYAVQRIVDRDLAKFAEELDGYHDVKWMKDFSTGSWQKFKIFVSNLSDNYHQLDEFVTFKDQEVNKQDYVSRRLSYSLSREKAQAYDELIGTLYETSEREKLEWAIGAVLSGDARFIQKFIVLYGAAGTGKSTVLNIIQKLFEGYYTTFEAKALTSAGNAFATEVFKSNPLVAIQHDGDLSRIEDNSKLNSIVSHEEMTMNEKYKPSYTSRINCFLFMGTNKPVKITDAKSGIIRRLIDVRPSGNKIAPRRYNQLVKQISYELGSIASYCLEVYNKLGPDYYSTYTPIDMMLQTDVFYNFVEANFYQFSTWDGVSLTQAYDMYKAYCDESLVDFKLPKYKFREELKNYFENFELRSRVDEKQVRSYYSGFLKDKFESEEPNKDEKKSWLDLSKTESLLDEVLGNCKAQYTSKEGTPLKKWINVKTALADIDTSKLHYVKPPENHIVLDFDLKNDKGEKDAELNLKSASEYPPTYAEYSKSGAGIHLHYTYIGDVMDLRRIIQPDIEVKVFTGDSSLRRQLTKCNDLEIATISSGLPLREKKMINLEEIKTEQHMRAVIAKALRKEVHANTRPNIDFINKILTDASEAGVKYDLTDLRPKILAFANNSSHQAEYCIKLVMKMPFKSESEFSSSPSDGPIVFYDVEVFPNLFVVGYKPEGGEKMIFNNPSPELVRSMCDNKLVGFNCRRYDNHILYAWGWLGKTNEELFEISQRIVSGSRNAFFGAAYNLSYTDILDFSSVKQSLKKFEIDLGIHHKELGLPWDQPVPEELWDKVDEYNGYDLDATEAVFHARSDDWAARQIIAQLAGMTPNDTTQQLAAKIIFKGDKHPQDKFVYTDLSEEFPGYTFDHGVSSYRGEDPKEGGYVYSEPGMYFDVALLDIASMHPHSAKALNIFGPYTPNYVGLVDARLSVKHSDMDSLSNYADGLLVDFLKDHPEVSLDKLAYALKIVINIIYGLTSAKFDNPFRDPRNLDNIVAKRGALFMINLKHEVQDRGFTVAHIKTDSIKIPNATPEIIQFVMDYGKKYGYTFEHEATYSRMCLVNDAVYIARYKGGKHDGEWTATGTQFAVPYVFKTLFSKEPIEFRDLCEPKAVSTSIYLDFNEGHEDEHDYRFVGKVGLFCPVKPGCGGALLMREGANGYSAVTGSKGYRWLESEEVETLGKQDCIDESYYRKLADDAVRDISKYGDWDVFISEDFMNIPEDDDSIPFDL